MNFDSSPPGGTWTGKSHRGDLTLKNLHLTLKFSNFFVHFLVRGMTRPQSTAHRLEQNFIFFRLFSQRRTRLHTHTHSTHTHTQTTEKGNTPPCNYVNAVRLEQGGSGPTGWLLLLLLFRLLLPVRRRLRPDRRQGVRFFFRRIRNFFFPSPAGGTLPYIRLNFFKQCHQL